MILYHGSNVSIESIDFSKSKPGKDFGIGFYLSADEKQAQEMAEKKALLFGGEPMVTPFEFDEKSAMTDSEISYKRYEKYSLDISEEAMSRETFMIEELVKEMAMRLMDERGFSMKEALDIVYNSETYSKVLDLRTGLFSQSTSYVYSILETEILTGKLG